MACDSAKRGNLLCREMDCVYGDKIFAQQAFSRQQIDRCVSVFALACNILRHLFRDMHVDRQRIAASPRNDVMQLAQRNRTNAMRSNADAYLCGILSDRAREVRRRL